MNEIEVPKGTGTYADSLRAIGTANILEEVSGIQTTIKDIGTSFKIECETDVAPETWNPPLAGFYYIWRKSKEKEKPAGKLVLNYEEEKSRAEQKKKSGKKKDNIISKALEEQGISTIEGVDKEYRPAAILESMRKGWSSDKEIYKWVMQNPREALEWVKKELLNVENIVSPIDVSNSQFYNPASGKGVHSAKTNYKSPGAISDEVIEPFAEWMKYRGAHIAMLPYRNGDDFKLFVIEPAEIGAKALYLLREELLKLNLWGGIRLDIEASLNLSKELIMHSDVIQESSSKINLRGKKPQEIVRGLRQAFFKSMGTAAALMNDAFLPLPNWFCIDNREDANAFLEIINEHIGYYENGKKNFGCLETLYEKRKNGKVIVPENVYVLNEYRKWLTTGQLFDLLEFFVRFAVHVMGKRGKKEWVKEFSTINLKELLERRYDMKEIIENKGFLSIARAMRNATITALWLQQQNKKIWDVRYGLAQKWKQKIKGGAKEFIPALSEFVQDYNWEVANLKKNNPSENYHTVSKEDIDQVINFIQNDGKDQTELIGMLLLAYGYAIDKENK